MQKWRMEQLLPQVLIVTRWNNKSQFQFHKDSNLLWTLFVIEKGSLRFRIATKQGIAASGELLLCPPDIPFEREVLEPLSFLSIYFRLFTPDGDEIREDQSLLPGMAGKLIIQDWGRVLSSCSYMERWRIDKDELGLQRKRLLLQDIWQLHAVEKEQGNQGGHMPQPDALMEQAEQWLRDNLASTVSIRRISDELGLSPVQFTRRFRSVYQATPSDYLAALRLRRVCRLLTETTMTLDQIAAKCGYESGLYVSRIFSKKMQMSPSQYRKAHHL
ncbi:helix-turn-helix domain-containing protein [Paenibacillus ginsengarvi]|uniref:AraC family transcriptional regulator n=1 Tax=Paenibacillus ginsengarvi TaxID=400777 RepID=A0A3B0CNM7_9BACL|nr:AraC family transcriptional regulator [Paenibacillus ginsengarvi]RKN86318.1 AraC family transcriptional regulator [Paenibacillus ginsengarvi]